MDCGIVGIGHLTHFGRTRTELARALTRPSCMRTYRKPAPSAYFDRTWRLGDINPAQV